MLRDQLTAAIEVAPGVVRRMAGERAVYTGSADDLVASGLLRRANLPGHLGTSRGMVTHHADGTPIGATIPADEVYHECDGDKWEGAIIGFGRPDSKETI